ADVGDTVQHLPLQVAAVHDVVVDHAERADTRGRQVEQHGGAEPARADHAHARRQQPPLRVLAQLGQQQVTRVGLGLLRRQRGTWLDEGLYEDSLAVLVQHVVDSRGGRRPPRMLESNVTEVEDVYWSTVMRGSL